jgi:hypothetical protein
LPQLKGAAELRRLAPISVSNQFHPKIWLRRQVPSDNSGLIFLALLQWAKLSGFNVDINTKNGSQVFPIPLLYHTLLFLSVHCSPFDQL